MESFVNLQLMSFGDNKVLSDVSFHINDNEKCAIVGINGVGKTTLLKIIMGEEKPDSGDVIISKDKSIGYLKQQQNIESERTIYEEMRLAKQHIQEQTVVFSLQWKVQEQTLRSYDRAYSCFV